MKYFAIVAITAVIGMAASVAQADTTLLAWETTNDQLYSVDTSVPDGTLIGGDNPSVIIAEIEFGGGVVYGSDTSDNTQLHLIDPDTGDIYETLTMTFPPEGNVITSMEFVDDVLYVGLTTEGGGTTYLSTVDLGSGLVSVVGSTGFDSPFGGLAYDGATMYGVSAGGAEGELFTVDLGSGFATSVGMVSVAGANVGLTALEFGDDGVLYALPNRSEGLAGHLLSIDPATAAGTDLGDTGYDGFVALTSPADEPTSVESSTWGRMKSQFK
ncbi:MAG: hypothetical protein GF346_09800 [Candidatus Eisenbacteria bacterium]|nr:hypothetical protein [Candidatus Latescibacterota bacterium]MBD3302727.1 hypothetical protein [Candidatus Eisenbacteria bacterium]